MLWSFIVKLIAAELGRGTTSRSGENVKNNYDENGAVDTLSNDK